MFATREIFIFLAFVSAIFATNVDKCKNQPFPNEVRIKGCDKPPCTFLKGTTINIQVDFKTCFPVQNLTPKFRTKILGIGVNHPLPAEQSAACNSLLNGSHCPLPEGKTVTYNLDFPISTSYPSLGVNAEFSLVNEANKVVTCFAADIKLKKA